MKSNRFSRRNLLAGTGAGMVLAPFVPLIGDAQEGTSPVRLLLVFSANGTIHENWRPSGGETDFSLSPILAPLEAHRNDLLIMDGMHVNDQGPGDDHMQGIAMLWSASRLLEGDEFEGGCGVTSGWGGGISVDQFIANRIGEETAFPSLEFGVQTGGSDIWRRMIYAGPNAPISPDEDPLSAFDRLFGNIGGDETELDRIRAERRSVIDAVTGDLTGLQTRVSSEDKYKIDAHLESIRSIEQRLQNDVTGCQPPELGSELDPFDSDNFPTILKLQMDIVTAALACNLTRVASLQMSYGVSGLVFRWLDISEGHHDISHEGDGNGGAKDQLTRINTWFSEQFAYLLDRMKSVQEGTGTLLDNSMVVFGNELAKGNSHSHDPMPFVVAGKAGGLIRPGRFLDLDGVSHSRLLVSMCHTMGLTDVDTFGDTDEGSGPLSGLS